MLDGDVVGVVSFPTPFTDDEIKLMSSTLRRLCIEWVIRRIVALRMDVLGIREEKRLW